uniref:CSN8_PSD8_EIF3K domain-containing protein n=1 Tax=Panagrellus redivivus TaxID=6233 RepID=A0A7E4VUU9_PANRE
MSSAEKSHKALLTAFAKDSKNLGEIEKALVAVKNALSEPAASQLSPAALSTIHRDFFEISALFSILKKDIEGFEKAIIDVQSFYLHEKADSTNKDLMTGLRLMFLLVKGRLNEFHMLIEQIPQSIQQSNPFIVAPVKFEQYLMEGAYNKVVLNEKTLPSPYYAMFIRILTDTVRGEIAACIEKSYKRILIKDAIQMLLYDNEAAALAFADARGWKREKDMFNFDNLNTSASGPPKAHLDTTRIAKQAIYYAKQLEMIV